MKAIFNTIFISLMLTVFYCCNTPDKKIQVAIDSTKSFISNWERQSKDHMMTDIDHKNFTDKCNQLVQYNKVQGIIRENLNEQQIKEVEKLYSRARSLKNKMILLEMQNDLTRRGSNWAGEKVEIGELNTDF